jgi:DNA-binding MarR family transcriptional regulator
VIAKSRKIGRRSGIQLPRDPDGPARPIDVGILPNLLGFNVRRAQIALWRDFGRTVGDGGVRPGMFSLLLLVERNPGIAQVDLANQLDQDKGTIVGLIDALQRRRWLVRRKSRVDRRRHGIVLTAAGQAGLALLLEEILEHEARFTRLFTDDELGTLIPLLRRIHT